MGVGKVASLGSRVEDPGRIFKIISPGSLCLLGGNDPKGLAVHPMCHPWGWFTTCSGGSRDQERTFSHLC